ncbi:murein biosynthesis integral membrane protein MurJ [Lujinxingia litoralis]|uniref:Probable lipid II flippase MurJ n=1 Tax=Lujinxingia litoralis TaxID=2211119 RepID=A0A328C5C2_9DELT|nr:murein biosynthesis integral membrane protein MurJ [Lujinxingia litoralis]RAL20220.1 murein biosynthesis integral membrane protein MurJ [Lujinxingia litoralis]
MATDAPDKAQKPAPSIGRRMGIAAIILAVSTLLSRILGFLREAVIVYNHGASATTDAYQAAFTMPDMMNYVLAGGTLSITFIPLFSSYVASQDEEGAWRLFSTIATTMGSVLAVFIALGYVLAPQIVPVLNPGFNDPEQLELAVSMTRIVLLAPMAFYIGGLLQGSLFVREIFWPSAIAPLIYNLCIILGGVLLDPWFGIKGFAIGVVVGALLGPLAVPMWAARHEVKFTPRFAPFDADFRAFLLLTLPLMVGVSLVTVDEWFLKYFGSLQGDGAITWLANARKLMMVIFAIIGQAAGQAALPFLTRLFHEGKEEEMGRMLARSLQRVGFLAMVGAAGLMVAAYPLVHAIFRHGHFQASDADTMAGLLIVFAGGLWSWAVQTLAVRGFYARKNTLTPMILGSVTVALAAPFYALLGAEFGVRGLAAATSLGMTLNALVTLGYYRLRVGRLPLMPIARGTLRGALHGAWAAGAAYGVFYLAGHAPADLGLMGLVVLLIAMGTAFFGALALSGWLFNPPELDVVLERVKRRLRRSA